MTPDAALDQVAFLVGLRLMGPDARRRLRLALVRSPDFIGEPGFDIEALDRLDALIDGFREPQSAQDRYELARAEQQRRRPAFDEAFWLSRLSDLARSGFTTQQAAQIVQSVRSAVEGVNHGEESDADQSQA